jgi:hypothetical protein
MFQPHSLLWHYLCVAPSALLLVVAAIFYRRSLQRQFPVFLLFAVVQGMAGLALYAMDLMPSVSDTLWWNTNWFHLLIEVVLKFALIGEIFSSVLRSYPALSKLGRTMIRGVGATLVLTSVAVAVQAHRRNAGMAGPSHDLNLFDFMIECGLLLFIFLFAAYFRLAWQRLAFGIALGRGIAASVQLATWAPAILEISQHTRHLFDFVDMGVYQVCVLIWLYYVVTTPKPRAGPPGEDDHYDHEFGEHKRGEPEPAEHEFAEEARQKNLDVWNRELERLLQ